jgi:hypothetical protein
VIGVDFDQLLDYATTRIATGNSYENNIM